ncbi:MAG: ribonuclease HII [Oscillospiraceae bacterium]|nr:ribonuclease HII [Oscillospiraceae bacterium]
MPKKSLPPVFEPLEEHLRALGFAAICGVDEAGRGPLAGDVYAAAVILPSDCVIEGLDDSKKLTPARRETLCEVISERALAAYVALATVAEIERINILRAALLAMRRAVDGLNLPADMALVDGNQPPPLEIPCQTIVRGDARCASIAAASILAKVSRDRAMTALEETYPGYGFAQHKGYGTKVHYEALARLGPCPAHRMSFLKNWNRLLG